MKYLGFQFDREFSSQIHINTISKKFHYKMSQLYPLKYSLPEYTKLNLIKSLVLPIFDYMDIIFHEFDSHGNVSSNNQLQKMHNTAIRFVYNLKYNEHISPYIVKSNLLPLQKRREIHALSMLYKIINNSAPPYLTHLIEINENNTRSKNKLIVHKALNNIHK